MGLLFLLALSAFFIKVAVASHDLDTKIISVAVAGVIMTQVLSLLLGYKEVEGDMISTKILDATLQKYNIRSTIKISEFRHPGERGPGLGIHGDSKAKKKERLPVVICGSMT